MKFISADYIKAIMKGDRLMQGNAEFTLYAQQAEAQVNALPSIDICFCRECKHWRAYETWSECERWTDDPYETAKTKADDFCSYGSRSEKPNNCETCKWGEWYRQGYDITMMDDECGGCCSWNSKWTPKTEPTISKMEQVDKDINVRSKDEPQTDWEKEKSEKSLCNSCEKDCDNRKRNLYTVECNRYEPQTEQFDSTHDPHKEWTDCGWK